MSCSVKNCKNKIYQEYAYESLWYSLVKKQRVSGRCSTCKKRFCRNHLLINRYDDDAGLIGENFYCVICYEKEMNEIKEKYLWVQKIPLVGWLVYKCLTYNSVKDGFIY